MEEQSVWRVTIPKLIGEVTKDGDISLFTSGRSK